jgi:hypothetical protein
LIFSGLASGFSSNVLKGAFFRVSPPIRHFRRRYPRRTRQNGFRRDPQPAGRQNSRIPTIFETLVTFSRFSFTLAPFLPGFGESTLPSRTSDGRAHLDLHQIRNVGSNFPEIDAS